MMEQTSEKTMTPQERRDKVKKLRESGMTFKAIGNQMGFSSVRAQYIYHRATMVIDNNIDSDLYRLRLSNEGLDIRHNVSGRTMNFLFRNGIDTVEKLKSLKLSDVFGTDGAGDKTLHEIAWFQKRCNENEKDGA